MTTYSSRSLRRLRLIDRRTTASHVAARNVALFFRDLASFVTFLLRTTLLALLFLPALLGAVGALTWNALTSVLVDRSRRPRSLSFITVSGFLLGVVLGRSCR